MVPAVVLTVAEVLSTAKALIEAGALILGEEKVKELRAFVNAVADKAPTLQDALDLVKRIASEVNLSAHGDREKIEKVAELNPAIRKPGVGATGVISALLLCLGLGLAAAGCARNKVQYFPESEGTWAYYGVVWPDGVTTDTLLFFTVVDENGDVITTAPARR